MTPLAILEARLADIRPQSLLYLSARPALQFETQAIAVRVRSDVTCVEQLADEKRYDCVLVADFLEHLPKAAGIAVLGRLRNLHASRLLVFVDHARCMEAWTLDDFIGLGFRHDATLSSGSGDDTHSLALYSYDLATYNHEREWNNPRFWANPELWGRYFW